MAQLKSKSIDWKDEFKQFSDFYLDDPSPSILEHELNLWEVYWDTYEGSKPNNVTGTLQLIDFPGFENIKTALMILGTLPVTSCECERSFSAIKTLKTFWRTTMTSERLNGLSLMYIHT